LVLGFGVELGAISTMVVDSQIHSINPMIAPREP
jgi:hypothetical protein